MKVSLIGVLLPHAASVVLELYGLVHAFITDGNPQFSSADSARIADIARNENRSGAEIVSGFSRLILFAKQLQDLSTGVLLVVFFNALNTLGVYIEELHEKFPEHIEVLVLSGGTCLLLALCGALSLQNWYRKNKMKPARLIARLLKGGTHIITLGIVVITGIATAILWTAANP